MNSDLRLNKWMECPDCWSVSMWFDARRHVDVPNRWRKCHNWFVATKRMRILPPENWTEYKKSFEIMPASAPSPNQWNEWQKPSGIMQTNRIVWSSIAARMVVVLSRCLDFRTHNKCTSWEWRPMQTEHWPSMSIRILRIWGAWPSRNQFAVCDICTNMFRMPPYQRRQSNQSSKLSRKGKKEMKTNWFGVLLRVAATIFLRGKMYSTNTVEWIAPKIRNRCDTMDSFDIRAYRCRCIRQSITARWSDCPRLPEIETQCVAHSERWNISASVVRSIHAAIVRSDMIYSALNRHRRDRIVWPIAIVHDRMDSVAHREIETDKWKIRRNALDEPTIFCENAFRISTGTAFIRCIPFSE